MKTKLLLATAVSAIVFAGAAWALKNSDSPKRAEDLDSFGNGHIGSSYTRSGKPQEPVPQLRIVSVEKCTAPEGDLYDSDKVTPDSVSFSWSEPGGLSIQHFNVIYNCCPDSIKATIHVDDSTLTIDEYEKLEAEGCKCNCAFNVFYEVRDLKAGRYKVRFVEQYFPESDRSPKLYLGGKGGRPLEFQATLEPGVTGSFSVPRFCGAWIDTSLIKYREM